MDHFALDACAEVAQVALQAVARAEHLMCWVPEPFAGLERAMVAYLSQEAVEDFLTCSSQHVPFATVAPEVRFVKP